MGDAHVTLRHRGRGSPSRSVGEVVDGVAVGIRAKPRQSVRWDGANEERVVHVRRPVGEDEMRLVDRRGRNVDRAVQFHEREQLVVDLLVAHAVADHVDACGDQPFHVVEEKHVRHHAQSAPVRFVDDRADNFMRHRRPATEVRIDPNLHDIGLFACEFGELLAGFFRRRRTIDELAKRHRWLTAGDAESAIGRKDPRLANRRLALRSFQLKDIVLIGPEDLDRVHSVGREGAQLTVHALGRVVVGGNRIPRDDAQVRMRIDQGGHHGFSGQVDRLRIARYVERAERAERGDPAIGDQHHRVPARRGSSAVDEVHPMEDFRTSGGRFDRPGQRQRGGSRKQEVGT